MKFGKYFVLIFLCVLILFAVALYTIYSDVKERTIRDLNTSQMIHARQSAAGIKDYMSDVINALNFLSHFQEVIDVSASGKLIMSNYQNLNSHEIKGITRVNKRGEIIYTYPFKESIGKDISNQDHVRLSMKTHKIVISDVFMTVQGFRAIAVHAPVFKNNVFDGTVAFLLSFDKIAQKYIENIRIGKNGFAWVISKSGVEISSPYPDHIGKNVYETYKNFPELISMIDKMLMAHEGVTVYNYNRNLDNNTEIVLKHAVYIPVTFGDTFWSLVVATPEDEITDMLSGIRINLFIVTFGLLLIFIIGIYLFVKFRVIVGEQKKREIVMTALQESESYNRMLFNQSPIGLALSRLDGKLVDVNSAYAEIIGRTIEEIQQLSYWDITPQKYVKQEEVQLNSLKTIGRYGPYEKEYIHKDGHFVPVRLRGLIIEKNDQKLIWSSVEDITERKKAEEAIHQSEIRYKQLLESITDYTYSVEIQNGHPVNTTHGSGCEKVTGYSTEDYLAEPKLWLEMVHPDDKKIVEHYADPLCEGKVIPALEHRLIHKNGTVIWVRNTYVLKHDESGKVIGYDGLISNITERKLAEEEIKNLNAELENRVLKRTAQLEAANEELEAFSYSVSHDLRAPLRHTSGYVDLLIKRCKSDLSEKGQHYLKSIADSVHQMGMLIDDLLQFSRTGRTEMRQSYWDMNEIVSEVLKELHQGIPNRNIEWSISELPSLFCDKAMLRLVWMNLLSNAIKFTKTRNVSKIEIGFLEEHIEYTFFVSDNGVGFDMQYSQKLFGVFQRLHPMEEFEGTGIGLANVRRIIRKHEGRTWANAELDKGAIFYFTLPKHNKEKL